MLLQAPVVALFKSLPMLTDVAILCGFSFFVFGTVAVQLFAGAMHNRWVLAARMTAGFAWSCPLMPYGVFAGSGGPQPTTYKPTSSCSPWCMQVLGP
jgi:hypothetical protein